MPRTKFKPHNEDILVIKDFLKQVSWGSECVLCHWLDGTKTYLLIPQKYILIPCHWSKFEQTIEPTINISAEFGVKPGVILHGECTPYDCDHVSWSAHKSGFVVYWIGVENIFCYGQMITKGLDGIDLWNPEN